MTPEEIYVAVTDFVRKHGLSITTYEGVTFKHEESGSFWGAESVDTVGNPKHAYKWSEEKGYH